VIAYSNCLSVTYFTKHNSLQLQPCCCKWQHFIYFLFLWLCNSSLGFPGGLISKESACNAGDLGSIPGLGRSLGKIPWRRDPLPTPVSWPEEFRGLYSPWGHTESDTTERLSLSYIWLHWVLVVPQGVLDLHCGMRDLVPQSGIEPRPPALGMRSLSH